MTSVKATTSPVSFAQTSSSTSLSTAVADTYDLIAETDTSPTVLNVGFGRGIARSEKEAFAWVSNNFGRIWQKLDVTEPQSEMRSLAFELAHKLDFADPALVIYGEMTDQTYKSLALLEIETWRFQGTCRVLVMGQDDGTYDALLITVGEKANQPNDF